MKRPTWLNVLIWLVALLASIVIIWQSRFTADMSFFLPTHPSPAQQALVQQLQTGALSRTLMVAIAGGDALQRAEVSQRLRSDLQKTGDFVTVQNGATDNEGDSDGPSAGESDKTATLAQNVGSGLAHEIAQLMPYRYVLSAQVHPQRFSVEGLRSAINDNIAVLASPIGQLFKPYLAQDPTGEMLTILEQFNPGAQPALHAGVWASQDGLRAMLLLQTRALGSDTDAQALVLTRLQTSFDRVAAQQSPTLKLHISGPGYFAVQARETIKREAQRLSLFSSVAIWLLLFLVYRSFRLLALGLIPVLSGTIAGIAMVGLVHGTVFGITIGFGSALIGEAVDYAIYYFVQAGQQGLAHWRRVFWPTIRLGVMTTVIGFGTLLFSGFPGLAQLGLYALSGVIAAALTTRFVLPVLAGQQTQVPAPARIMHTLMRLLGQAHTLRLPMLLLALLTAVYLYGQRDQIWSADLSALSSATISENALDDQMRRDLAAPDARYLISISGDNQEQVLQKAERVAQQLDPLVAQGVIGGYDSPTRFLPSLAQQQARLASLPGAAELRTRLQTALADAPVAAHKLEPFIADVEKARHLGTLTRAHYQNSAIALALDTLLQHHADGHWSVIVPLRPAPHAQAATIPAAVVQKALQDGQHAAVFVDLKAEFEAMYGAYVDEALQLAWLGALAIALLLALALRSLKRLLRVLFTLTLAVGMSMALLRCTGIQLHLLHLVGMLFIVAVGSNYALFLDDNKNGEPLNPNTLLAMVVAVCTTIIGFGMLASSSVPVLQAMGVTVAPGVLLALVLAAVFVYTAPSERR